eukprot:TRINITY_DN5774_c0_g1_i1.p1 TRINITY_DN5774_c0_g1~~TRINITY_DN5774_c0_g1_i1.p1  ORF type:complete len:690 (+),score=185.91 TRINITY_DN5774_c0_g1_i1:84-2153(+)
MFICQRCGQPVEVDPTLLNIDPDLLARGEVDLERLKARGGATHAHTNGISMPYPNGHVRSDFKHGRIASSVITDKRMLPGSRDSFYSMTNLSSSVSTIGFLSSTLSDTGTGILRKPRERIAESPVPRTHAMHRSATQSKLFGAHAPSTSPSSSSFAQHYGAHMHRSSSALAMSDVEATFTRTSAGNVHIVSRSPSPSPSSTPPHATAIPNGSPVASLYPGMDTNSDKDASSGVSRSLSSDDVSRAAMSPPFSSSPSPSPSPSSSLPYTSSSTSPSNPPLPPQPALPMQSHITPARLANSTGHLSLRYLRSSTRSNDGSTSSSNLLSSQLASQSKPVHYHQNDLLAAKIFAVASEQNDVDYPICFDCTKILLAEAEDDLAVLEAQNNSYATFLAQLDKREASWSSSNDDIAAEIIRLEEEERQVRLQLERLEQDETAVDEEARALEAESERLGELESAYWGGLKKYQSLLGTFLDERDSVARQIEGSMQRLERLRRTHILNDSFHIWHDGHFGTINSFRLGRLPSQPVDWNEINAAWGLVTQLLSAMSKRMASLSTGPNPGFKFTQYRLLPLGSQSKMERIDNGSTYELFGSSDISLGRLFWYRRFDNAMVAFQMCLKEMADYVESQDKTLQLPYRMDRDKVGDMSIKIQFNNEETWTKSLKYMVSNLKWLLAWIARREMMQLELRAQQR